MGRTFKPEDGLTLKALAVRVAAKFDEESVKVSRLLQTWINANIVKPEGPVHSGPGRYRTFTNEELDKAALIFELHRHGYPLNRLHTIRQLIDYSLEKASYKGILDEARQGKPWEMQIGLRVNGDPEVRWILGEAHDVYLWNQKKFMAEWQRRAEKWRSRLFLRVDTILQDL